MYTLKDYSEEELEVTLRAARKELNAIRHLAIKMDMTEPPSPPSEGFSTVDQLTLIGDYLRRARASYNMSNRVKKKHTWVHRYPSQKHRQLIYMEIRP